MRRALGLMRTLDHRSHPIVDTPATVCAVELRPSVASSDIKVWARRNLDELVGALIRSQPGDLDEGVIRKIDAECAPMNEKNVTAYTLVTRQGLVHVTSRERQSQPDFRVLVELQSQALAVRSLLASFRAKRGDAPASYDFYLDIARGLIENVDVAIPSSFTSAVVWRRLIEVHRLRDRLNDVLDQMTSERLEASRDRFAPLRESYWLDEDLTWRLSEAHELSEGRHVDFVGDPQLRRVISRDLLEARTCVRARAFKAALVLAGSVAEALLLSVVLSAVPGESATKLHKLGLHDLIGMVRALRLLPDDHPTLKLTDEWLCGYRSLIHPGVERGKGDTPTENNAEIAVRAVEQLVEDLAAALAVSNSE